MILALVADVMARHPIDRDRVYLAGLSAGGAMAAILAEQAPDVFAAVGVMAGVPLHVSHDVPSALSAMHGDLGAPDVSAFANDPPPAAYRRMRATVWTGAHDRTVHPVNAAVLAQQFLRLFGMTGADAVLEERGDVAIERWIDKTGLVRVESWNVRDMGHAWSGGSFRGSHTYPRGPRASDAMMEFFLRDRRAV